MIVNHNIPALNTYHNMMENYGNSFQTIGRLSSGLRINSASYDAAGLAISEKTRSMIRGLNRASQNALEGKSLLSIAEGALQETHSMLGRMKELAVQASNDTLSNKDRENAQSEITELISEIDHIARSTKYNTMSLLDGTFSVSGKSPHAAAMAAMEAKYGEDMVAFQMQDASLNINEPRAILDPLTEGTFENNDAFTSEHISVADDATFGAHTLSFVKDEATGKYQVTLNHNTFESQSTTKDGVAFDESALNLSYVTFDFSDAKLFGSAGPPARGEFTFTVSAGDQELGTARIDLTGINLDYSQFSNDISAADAFDNIASAFAANGNSLVFHVGAQENQTISMNIDSAFAEDIGLTGIDLSTRSSANDAISKIDGAIDHVSTMRSNMGAVANRLGYTINNLGSASENLSAAESRIRDSDTAKDVMFYTKSTIQSWAAQAMYAQANLMPSGIINFLR